MAIIGSTVIKLVGLMMVTLVVVSAPKSAAAGMTCGYVARELGPCINYVENGGTVPVACCTGVKTLYNAAQTTPDRQAVCKCLKSAVANIPYTGFNLGLAAGLPAKCHVNLPYKIDPSTNCDNVK